MAALTVHPSGMVYSSMGDWKHKDTPISGRFELAERQKRGLYPLQFSFAEG